MKYIMLIITLVKIFILGPLGGAFVMVVGITEGIGDGVCKGFITSYDYGIIEARKWKSKYSV